MTKQCPHCKGNDLYKSPVHNHGGVPVSFKKSVFMIDYVCGSCGFIQRFIDDPAHRDLIRQHWAKVDA